MPRTSERVVVLVDGSPAGAAAVRRAAALAGLLRADLVAAVPERTGSTTHEDERATREIADDAADLGAEVVRVDGDDVAAAVAGLTRTRGATHLVVAHRPQTRLERLRHASLVEVLLEALPGVEVLVVGPGRPG